MRFTFPLWPVVLTAFGAWLIGYVAGHGAWTFAGWLIGTGGWLAAISLGVRGGDS